MNIEYKNYGFSFISLWLHLIFFILLGLQLPVSSVSVPLGELKTTTISSYLYQDKTETTVSPTKLQQKTSSLSQVAATQKINQQPHKISLSHSSTEKQAAQKFSGGNGQAVPTLLSLLHAAIQKQQHYPESAMEMEREGRTTLKFTLFTNGQIDHLRIIKSSGTNSLDEAALAAVNDAAPFQHIEKFIQGPQEYQIDVVFELA